MDDSKRKLERLADAIAAIVEREREMAKARTFPPSIPVDVAEWFLAGARSYLSEDANSLDGALGLKAKRGRPIKPGAGKAFERARQAWAMRVFENKTWEEILSEMEEAGVVDGLAESTLRESVDRYEARFLAEFIKQNPITIDDDKGTG